MSILQHGSHLLVLGFTRKNACAWVHRYSSNLYFRWTSRFAEYRGNCFLVLFQFEWMHHVRKTVVSLMISYPSPAVYRACSVIRDGDPEPIMTQIEWIWSNQIGVLPWGFQDVLLSFQRICAMGFPRAWIVANSHSRSEHLVLLVKMSKLFRIESME